MREGQPFSLVKHGTLKKEIVQEREGGEGEREGGGREKETERDRERQGERWRSVEPVTCW